MEHEHVVILLTTEQLIEQLNIQIALRMLSAAQSGDYDDYAPSYTRLRIIRDLLENHPDDIAARDDNALSVDLSAHPYTRQVYHSGFEYQDEDFRQHADRLLYRGKAMEELDSMRKGIKGIAI